MAERPAPVIAGPLRRLTEREACGEAPCVPLALHGKACAERITRSRRPGRESGRRPFSFEPNPDFTVCAADKECSRIRFDGIYLP